MKIDWKNIVRKVAPALGAGLGGPLAGAATKYIADKVLGKPEASEDEIEAWVYGASPEQLLKLKEMDQQFERDMKALDVDVFKLEMQDRASAREMFKGPGLLSKLPQIVLSSVFVIGYFVVVFSLGGLFAGIEPSMTGALHTILGVLTAGIPQILNFWFGSSSGSKDKTDALASAISGK